MTKEAVEDLLLEDLTASWSLGRPLASPCVHGVTQGRRTDK